MEILIADDHTLFRDALSYYIKREHAECSITSVADVFEAEGVLSDQNLKKPIDVVLLDLLMPGMNGLQGVRRVLALCPKTPVLLMSGVASADDVKQAMTMGCSGYFPKTLSCDSLIKGLDLVMSGEKYVPINLETGKVLESSKVNGFAKNDHGDDESQDIHTRWMRFRETSMRERKQILKDNRSDGDIHLTRREKDVLIYLMRGDRNKDIADALGVKTVTIKLHVRSICRKLGVQNRTQAALKANQLKLMEASHGKSTTSK